MSSFIFNTFKERFLKGEVPVSDTWVARPVNSKFKELFDQDDIKLQQYRTSADFMQVASLSGISFENECIEKLYKIQHVYTKNSDGNKITDENKPLFVTAKNWSTFVKYFPNVYDVKYNGYTLYESFFTQTGQYVSFIPLSNNGFYWVTTVDELHWCANRVNGDIEDAEKTDEFNNNIIIVLGDDIGEMYNKSKDNRTLIDFCIGKYPDRPFEGLFFGNNYAFRNINLQVKSEAAGIIGYLGQQGCISNVNWFGETRIYCYKPINLTFIKNGGYDICVGCLCGVNYGIIMDCYIGQTENAGDNNQDRSNKIYLQNFRPSVYLVQNKSEDIEEIVGDAEANSFYPNYMCLNSPGNLVPYLGYFNEGVFGTVSSENENFWTSPAYDSSNFDTYGIWQVSASEDETDAGYDVNFKFYDGNIIKKTFQNEGLSYETSSFNKFFKLSNDKCQIIDEPIRLHQFDRAAYYVSPLCGNNKGAIIRNTVNVMLYTNDTFVGFIGGICGKYSGHEIIDNTVRLDLNDDGTRQHFIVPDNAEIFKGQRSYLHNDLPKWSKKLDDPSDSDINKEFQIETIEESAMSAKAIVPVNYHGIMFRAVDIPYANVKKDVWWYSSATQEDIISDINCGICKHGKVGNETSEYGIPVNETYYCLSAIPDATSYEDLEGNYDAYIPLYPKSQQIAPLFHEDCHTLTCLLCHGTGKDADGNECTGCDGVGQGFSCKECDGTGIDEDGDQCDECKGSGIGESGIPEHEVDGTFDVFEDYIYDPILGSYCIKNVAYDVGCDYIDGAGSRDESDAMSKNIIFYKPDEDDPAVTSGCQGFKFIDVCGNLVMTFSGHHTATSTDETGSSDLKKLTNQILLRRPRVRTKGVYYRSKTGLQEATQYDEAQNKYTVIGSPMEIYGISGFAIKGTAQSCFSGAVVKNDDGQIVRDSNGNILFNMMFDMTEMYIKYVDNDVKDKTLKHPIIEHASAGVFSQNSASSPTNFIYAKLPENTQYINQELKSIHCAGGICGSLVYGTGSYYIEANGAEKFKSRIVGNNIKFTNRIKVNIPVSSDASGNSFLDFPHCKSNDYAAWNRFGGIAGICELNSCYFSDWQLDGSTDPQRQMFIADNRIKYDEGGDGYYTDTSGNTWMKYGILNMVTDRTLDPGRFGIASPLIAETRPTYISVPSINSYINDSFIYEADTTNTAYYVPGFNVNPDAPHSISYANGRSRLNTIPLAPVYDANNPNGYSTDLNIDLPIGNVFDKINGGIYNSWLPFETYDLPSKIYGFEEYNNIVYNNGYMYFDQNMNPLATMYTPSKAYISFGKDSSYYNGSKKIATYPYFGSSIALVKYIVSDRGEEKPDDWNGLFRSNIVTPTYLPNMTQSHDAWNNNVKTTVERKIKDKETVFTYKYISNVGNVIDNIKMPVTFATSPINNKTGYWYMDPEFVGVKGSIKGRGYNYDGTLLHLGIVKHPTTIRTDILTSGLSYTSSISASDFQGLYITDSIGRNVMYIDTGVGETNGLLTWEKQLSKYDTRNNITSGLLLEVK